MADKSEKSDDKDEKKGGGPMKLVLLIVVPLLLVVIGGLVAFLLLRPTGTSESTDAEATPTETETHVPDVPVAIEAITINLADGHFLQLAFALQPDTTLLAETTTGEVDTSEAVDIAINLFSGMSVEELGTAKGRNGAKEEFLAEVEEAYDGVVYDVYFTSFVMQ